MTAGPSVVALGGGHGTAATLRACRHYAGKITAIVSVADDGGSSGRLSEVLGVPALGDLRKCLVALAAPESDLAAAMEHRFTEGEMEGHALGNMLLAGLIHTEGGLVNGLAAAARLLGVDGTILPATEAPVRLTASGIGGPTTGQAAIARSGGVEEVGLEPSGARSPQAACDAIAAADQVLIGPGSLYTSVLACVLPPQIRAALQSTSAMKVYVCNLRPQVPETAGYSVADHVAALERHGVFPDIVLCDTSSGLTIGDTRFRLREEMLARSNGLVHDPTRLGAALVDLADQHRVKSKVKYTVKDKGS